MKTEKKQRRTRGQGFTLIEVALAVAVVAVGVLGLFALISTGLDASAKATATTQAAFFADATMNAMRAECASASAAGSTNWKNFVQGMMNRQTNFFLTVAAANAWRGTVTVVLPPAGSASRKLSLTNAPFHSASLQTITSGYLWYSLGITQSTNSGRTTANVTLGLWPRGGSAAPASAPTIVYYSEFPDMGQL
jgi:prepilin-type N-terminal cleavage/methylation domain-containing protein